MKTIGIFHYQVGRTDGVSLEIDKWKRVLEEIGHTVHLCAGDLGDALFIEGVVGGRQQTRDGQKIYSLWDAYVFADFVTYPSLWEEWGNQFLEALRGYLARLIEV